MAGMAFFIIASLLSLPLFALAVSPWSENRRVPVFIAGVVMFISGLPFLLATLLEARVDWYFFTFVLIAACVMLFVSRGTDACRPNSAPLWDGWRGPSSFDDGLHISTDHFWNVHGGRTLC